LEVSTLAENLGHEDGQISENDGINDSTSQVDSHDENVLNFSLRTEFVTANDEDHIVHAHNVSAPHVTVRKACAGYVGIKVFITTGLFVAEEVTFGVIPEIVRGNPLDDSAVVRVVTVDVGR